MESFNQVPGAVPDESERIDDVEKAEAMATSAASQRESAARRRAYSEELKSNPVSSEKAALDPFGARGSEYWAAAARQDDENADTTEKYAGHLSDIRKENPGLNENEVALEARKRQEQGTRNDGR